MAIDNTFNAPLSPIQRQTPEDRIVEFNKNSFQIYNKFSPYDQSNYGSRGPQRPFIYTKITDSESAKRRTADDSQAIPTNSTLVDVSRMTKFLRTGTGIKFLATQQLLQNTNVFNETRIYNPGSILGATAKAGSFGLIDRPNRHLRTNGGIVNFFIDSILSSIGYETRDFSKAHIEGTAGTADNSALPTYSRNAYRNGLSGAEAGLVRLATAKKAFDRFDTIWAGSVTTNGGILQRLVDSIFNRINSLLPSTNPLGIFQGSTRYAWQYRPEYLNNRPGIYYKFLNNRDLLGYSTLKHGSKFYNDPNYYIQTNAVLYPKTDFHFYYPESTTSVPRTDRGDNWYFATGKQNVSKLLDQEIGTVAAYDEMLESAGNEGDASVRIPYRMSMERYETIKYRPLVGPTINFPSYFDIPNDGKTAKPYSNFVKNNPDAITLDKRGFAKVSKYTEPLDQPGSFQILDGPDDGSDKYNSSRVLDENAKNEMYIDQDQSKDLIFFYFNDIINSKYIPFRATLSSLNEQHNADWEEIKYMGRADSLYVYKGFSRDLGFTFRVYANSVKELIPMWDRVNYLVGLVRPSKYTERAIRTRSSTINTTNPFLANIPGYTYSQVGDTANGITQMTPYTVNENIDTRETTGRESQFIYPPMINFRIGDLYVEQPGILSSVSMTIPEEATWESFRGDSYKYLYGIDKTIDIPDTPSRQLPTIIDVTVSIKVLEKKRSITNGSHYGLANYDSEGKVETQWVLDTL